MSGDYSERACRKGRERKQKFSELGNIFQSLGRAVKNGGAVEKLQATHLSEETEQTAYRID